MHIDAATVEAWKAKHRGLACIEVEDCGEKFRAYFKRPDMKTLSLFAKMAKQDEILAMNTLFDECYLGGDEIVKEDAVIKMSVFEKLSQVIGAARAEIKNL